MNKYIIFTILFIGITATAFSLSNYSSEKSNSTTTIEEKSATTTASTTTSINKPITTTPPPKPTPTTPAPEPKAPIIPPTEPVVKSYTLAEVSLHTDKNSCWTVVNSKVYDITSYVPRHPGGEKQILKICGKNGTSLFEGQHGGDSKPEKMLASLYIGELK